MKKIVHGMQVRVSGRDAVG
ncbi:UNVERIFIED_CONTAM: hypothetical protein GTU68_035958 [Idotea baltica]|nr:hypothetical protein [Idotea baltica]